MQCAAALYAFAHCVRVMYIEEEKVHARARLRKVYVTKISGSNSRTRCLHRRLDFVTSYLVVLFRLLYSYPMERTEPHNAACISNGSRDTSFTEPKLNQYRLPER